MEGSSEIYPSGIWSTSTLVEDDRRVICSGRCAVGSLLPDTDCVDGLSPISLSGDWYCQIEMIYLRVTDYVSRGRAGIHHERMSKLVSSVSYSDDTLALSIPLKILSLPAMNLRRRIRR